MQWILHLKKTIVSPVSIGKRAVWIAINALILWKMRWRTFVIIVMLLVLAIIQLLIIIENEAEGMNVHGPNGHPIMELDLRNIQDAVVF